jgi:ubiquinone/menaquinone biosynthesis C-methylase UbiE
MGMGVKAEDLAGKVILDAGCGSGALSIALAESYEMEVVAMDLAAGIEQAYAYNRNPFVYFVQGSVLEPPFRHGSVDFLYCAGVLVAIPEPKLGLRTLAPILKPGGRYFTWWYHPIDRRHHPNDLLKMATYNWIRENVTSRLTIGMQRALYMGSMPLYFLKRELENMFREQRNTTTWREKMQDLTDMFSPVYQHRYTEEEIVQWYEELRFVDASIGYQEAYGFGVRGDSPAL